MVNSLPTFTFCFHQQHYKFTMHRSPPYIDHTVSTALCTTWVILHPFCTQNAGTNRALGFLRLSHTGCSWSTEHPGFSFKSFTTDYEYSSHFENKQQAAESPKRPMSESQLPQTPVRQSYADTAALEKQGAHFVARFNGQALWNKSAHFGYTKR